MRETLEAIRVLGFWRTVFYRTLYRPLMRLAHRFNWHYAPPSYIEKDIMRWCQWCGMRDVTRNPAYYERPTNTPREGYDIL